MADMDDAGNAAAPDEGADYWDEPAESIPTPLRAIAGLAALAIEESRRLPTHLVGLPVLAISTALQASMRLQQRYAELVARGDELLASLSPAPDAAPPWARFDDEDDEDEPEPDDYGADHHRVDGYGADHYGADDDTLGDPDNEGPDNEGPDNDGPVSRASGTRAPDTRTPGTRTPGTRTPDDEPAAQPAPAADGAANHPSAINGSPLPGYDDMSIAQLRARLRTLDAARLEALIAHEARTQGRPPYLTMLSNRLDAVRSGTAGRRRA